MTPILLAAILYQGQTADIHLKAMPLERALDQLVEIYHTPMTLSNLLKDKIVLIEASQVTLDEVKKQIALAVDASWEMKDSGWHLGQDTKQQKASDERSQKFRKSVMQKTIELRKTTPASSAPYNEAFAAQSYNQSQQTQSFIFAAGPSLYGLPEQRLMTRFLVKFGAERISAVEPGKRVVYALQPNAMQKPIGFSFDQELADFRKENDIWGRVQTKLRAENDAALKGSQQGRLLGTGNISPGIPDEVGNVYFSIYADASGLDELSLTVVSKSPSTMFFATSATSMESIFSKMGEEDFSSTPKTDFQLSQEAENFRSILSRETSKLSPQAISIFLDPTKNDPLSYGLSESLAYDANRLKKNIIALVGDTSMSVSSPTITSSYFDQRFIKELDGIVVEDGSWIRFNSLPLEGPTFPRGDLKRFIANSYRTGSFTIEDYAGIAARSERRREPAAIRNLVSSFAKPDRVEGANFDVARCLGLLEPGEQNQAMSRTGIRYGALNAKLRQHLAECVFDNPSCSLIISPKSPKIHETFPSIEPTLLVPAGIPSQAIFQIEREAHSSIRVITKDQPEGVSMTAFGWGQVKYANEHPDQMSEYSFPVDLDAPAYRDTQYTFLFHLYINEDCQWINSLERTVKSNDQPFSLRNLPQEFRSDYEAGYQAAAKEAKKTKEPPKKGDGDAHLSSNL